VRVALNIVKQRRKRLRSLIRSEGFLTVASVRLRLGVSEATARRDLAAIAAKGQITRTRGGGLATSAQSPPVAPWAPRGSPAPEPGPDSQGPAQSPAMSPRTTLRDIAERTGFAKTTVSLALRNSPKIPEATRHVVRRAASDLGYRPDPALARIAGHRWRAGSSQSGTTVAYVTAAQVDPGESPDSQAMAGARARARELGYGFEHFRLDRFPSAGRLGGVLFHRGIGGVIVGPIAAACFHDEFPWGRFAAVGCNTGQVRPPVHVVVPDAAHATTRAWRQAVDCGYRRIGLALIEGGHPDSDSDRICAALHCQSLLPPGEPRVPALQVGADGGERFLAWMARHRPEAVVGSGCIFLRWMREAGMKVPQEAGFISLTAAPPGAAVAGMDCSMEMVGRAAAEQLDILIRTNQVGIPRRPFALMVESRWIPGDTIRGRALCGQQQALPGGGGPATRRESLVNP
jgi:LacI family transcriptional regulator